MIVKTQITEMSHDDLVNLFSTATYGSSWLHTRYNKKEYQSLPDASDNDCIEDKLAKLLLADKVIYVCDTIGGSDDSYGVVPCVWDEDNEMMEYAVRLEDIILGLEKCFNGYDEFLKRYAFDLMLDNGDLDLFEADAIMQVILFGKVIYC